MELNLIIAIIILLISIFITCKYRKNSGLGKITILLAGLFISIVILVYPLSSDTEDTFQRIVFSILYSIQCIYVGQDFEIVQSKILLEKFSSIYVLVIYIDFLLAPVLTTGVIFSLLESLLHKIICKLSFCNPFKKEAHIFSNITKESVTLAESIKSSKNNIIFCNEKKGLIYLKKR